MLNHNHYTSEFKVRPDDIDMFQHVHSSKYIDYVLAARYEQMAACYGMPMEEFLEHNFGWVIHHCRIDYKRPLLLGDIFTVTTWLENLEGSSVMVKFEIHKKQGNKISCSGTFHYTLINLQTARAEIIPGWIIERYSTTA